ncbi:MAG: hypothetical protein RI907_2724 [Pseudomonadota bacterium]
MPRLVIDSAAHAVAAPLPFRQLFYRYWFFGWLFKDVNRADMFERSRAWLHNREQARWLPTYLRRWALLTVASYLIGMLMEHGLGAPVVSSLLYVQAILGVVFNALTSALLLGLKVLPGPL